MPGVAARRDACPWRAAELVAAAARLESGVPRHPARSPDSVTSTQWPSRCRMALEKPTSASVSVIGKSKCRSSSSRRKRGCGSCRSLKRRSPASPSGCGSPSSRNLRRAQSPTRRLGNGGQAAPEDSDHAAPRAPHRISWPSRIPGSTWTSSTSPRVSALTLGHRSHSVVVYCWNIPGPSWRVTIFCWQLHCLRGARGRTWAHAKALARQAEGPPARPSLA